MTFRWIGVWAVYNADCLACVQQVLEVGYDFFT